MHVSRKYIKSTHVLPCIMQSRFVCATFLHWVHVVRDLMINLATFPPSRGDFSLKVPVLYPRNIDAILMLILFKYFYHFSAIRDDDQNQTETYILSPCQMRVLEIYIIHSSLGKRQSGRRAPLDCVLIGFSYLRDNRIRELCISSRK